MKNSSFYSNLILLLLPLIGIAQQQTHSEWLMISERDSVTSSSFFNEYGNLLGLRAEDDMELYKTEEDDLGFVHYHFQQKYKGLKVIGGQYYLHAKGNYLKHTNGRLILPIDLNIVPSISKENALNIALDTIKTLEEQKIFMLNLPNNFTINPEFEPEIELVITRPIAEELNPSNFRLMYTIQVKTIKPTVTTYYIKLNAMTGEIIEIPPSTMGTTGTVTTLFNGVRNIETKWTGSLTQYKLIDETRGNNIETKNSGAPTQFMNDADNVWDDSHTKRINGSAHWAAQQTWDYYLNTFNRNGPDGSGMGLAITADQHFNQGTSYVCQAETEFASDPLEIVCGAAVSGQCNPMTALDIMGHEFTHGVGYNEAQWTLLAIGFQTETRALAESFCDIFGEMVENYVIGTVDWKGGAQSKFLTTLQRVFFPPVTNGEQAMVYGDLNWTLFPDGHQRGGVQNHWFHLLSEGGTSNGITVSGIGKDNAARIAYRNLTTYMQQASDYSDAKNGAIFSAMELFGNCSNEVLQTVLTWNAVGVSSVNGFYYDNTVNCTELAIVHEGLDPIFFPSPSPVTISVIHNLTANCNITANGQPVTFIAGNEISLNEGFRSGNNFRAILDPCVGQSNKTDNNDPYGGNSQDIETQDNIQVLDKIKESKIKIFPNPNNGSFTLSIASESNLFPTDIFVYDALGNKVYEALDVKSPNLNINISNESKGIYLVRVQKGIEQFLKKVVKQ